MPGLIVDWLDGHAVIQVRNLGMEKLKPLWLPILIERCESVFEKSDMAGREEEGMGDYVRQLHGVTPDRVEIVEDGVQYSVPVRDGLKTGHFLDQRNSKRRLADRVRHGDKVLDCFCYTGGFSLAAGLKGATCFGVDVNPVAMEVARENAKLNGLEIPFIQGNAFDYLSDSAAGLGPYDWIILDPPAIAKTKDKRDSLKWGIWKLVNDAIPILAPGGRMVVCACTAQMSVDACWDVIQLSAGDRGVRVVLEEVTLQDLDHPAAAHFPQSLYLKCLWVRRLD
jgi:23S rRNA (cytosine1962-C5)-methyltransferase